MANNCLQRTTLYFDTCSLAVRNSDSSSGLPKRRSKRNGRGRGWTTTTAAVRITSAIAGRAWNERHKIVKSLRHLGKFSSTAMNGSGVKMQSSLMCWMHLPMNCSFRLLPSRLSEAVVTQRVFEARRCGSKSLQFELLQVKSQIHHLQSISSCK